MKRQISKANFSLVSTELENYESNGLITGEQKNDILEIYDVKGGLNFIRVVVTIGALLVGLGILSFIASNWDGISNQSLQTRHYLRSFWRSKPGWIHIV